MGNSSGILYTKHARIKLRASFFHPKPKYNISDIIILNDQFRRQILREYFPNLSENKNVTQRMNS